MLGYYQFGGDGGMQWRAGYRPGCSPQERGRASYLKAKRLKDMAKRGEVPCVDCDRPIADDLPGHCCVDCRRVREERERVLEERAKQERIYRLRHGRGRIVMS